MFKSVYPIPLKLGQRLRLVALGDVHWDTPECDRDRLSRFVAWCQERQQQGEMVRLVGLGDYLDFGSPSERKVIGSGTLHETTAVKLDRAHLEDLREFVALMKPIGKNFLGLLTGHHHYLFATKTAAGIWKGRSSDEWLANQLGCEYWGNGVALYRLTFPHGLFLDMFAWHGGGGAQTPGGRVQKRIRVAEIAPTAHIVATAHDNAKLVYPRSGLDFEKGSIKRYVIGAGCYDNETELLTDAGWMRYDGLDVGQRALALDPLTGESRYEIIERVWRMPWNGPLWAFKNARSVNLLVTPNHRMTVTSTDGPPYRHVPANELATTQRRSISPHRNWANHKGANSGASTRTRLPKTSIWKGLEVPIFRLPAYDSGWRPSQTPGALKTRQWIQQHGPTGKARRRRDAVGIVLPKPRKWFWPERHIAMDDWLAFLGLYLAEGSVTDTRVSIAQKICRPEIVTLLDRLPWKWRRAEAQWWTCDPQLAAWVHPLGKSWEKAIPREFMELSARQLVILLNWMMLGDGHTTLSGYRTYFTASPVLAGDVQELAQKTGTHATVHVRDRRGPLRFPNGHGIARHLSYDVHIYKAPGPVWLPFIQCGQQHYQGDVWCVTTSSGIVYVRRHGKALWCGNSFQRAYLEGPEAGYAEQMGLIPADLGVAVVDIHLEQRHGHWRVDCHVSV